MYTLDPSFELSGIRDEMNRQRGDWPHSGLEMHKQRVVAVTAEHTLPIRIELSSTHVCVFIVIAACLCSPFLAVERRRSRRSPWMDRPVVPKNQT